jgi:hypothetical protein
MRLSSVGRGELSNRVKQECSRNDDGVIDACYCRKPLWHVHESPSYVACGRARWFLIVVVQHVVQVDSSDTSGDTPMAQEKLVNTVEAKIIPVLVEIVAKIGASLDAECDATILGTVQVGENVANCESTAESWVQNASIDAVAEAGAAAAAYSCEQDPAVASVDTVATATATAFAEALSGAHAQCKSAGSGSACVLSRTAIQTVVTAQARAWAGAWAEAKNDCGCAVQVDVEAEKVADIIVDAASDVYVEVCAEGAFFVLASARASLCISTGHVSQP